MALIWHDFKTQICQNCQINITCRLLGDLGSFDKTVSTDVGRMVPIQGNTNTSLITKMTVYVEEKQVWSNLQRTEPSIIKLISWFHNSAQVVICYDMTFYHHKRATAISLITQSKHIMSVQLSSFSEINVTIQ